MSGHKLLREYIREVLKEDDGGVYGDLAMTDATMSPWGVSFGSGDDLYNIFVKPFTDVVQTAAGKTKELSAKGQTLLRVAFETIATTLIPVLTDSYNEIFEKDRERIEAIRQEYGEVYKANWDAFKDEDAQLLMFMYDPARYVASKVAKKAPGVALNLISIASGGTLDSYINKVKHALGIEGGTPEPKHGTPKKHNKNIEDVIPKGYGSMPYAMEGVLREDEQPGRPTLDDVLQNPKLIARVDNGPVARKMRAQAQQLVHQSLAQVFKQAQGVLRANSLQDLQSKVGKRLPGTEKLQGLPPEQRKAAEQQVMVGVKKSMKAFYIKSLEQQIKKAAQAAGTDDHPLIQDYKSVLSKIKGL